MSGKIKASIYKIVILGGPALILVGLGYYDQYKNVKSRLVLESAKFVYETRRPSNRPLFHIYIRVTYTGRKPEWWGNRGTWLRLKDVQLKESDGSPLKLSTVKPYPSPLAMQQSGRYIESDNAYDQVLTTGLPVEPNIDGGSMEAAVQIVESPASPHGKVYAEDTVTSSINLK